MTSGLLAYPILLLLRAMKSRQTVSQYAPEGHAKKQGTPTMGGLIIIAGFVVSQVIQSTQSLGPPQLYHYFYFQNDFTGESGPIESDSLRFAKWALLALFLLFALVGFVDDYVVPRLFSGKRGLGWKQKIVLELLASLAFAIPTCGTHWVPMGVTVFLILFFSNAFNFADGLDGLSGSLLLTMVLGLGGVAIELGHPGELGPLAALAGATIPFLFLNAPPAKVFMGDVGSLPIGAVLGAVVAGVALPASRDATQFAAWPALLVWSVVMIVELVPVPLQIASVKLRKKKLFLYTPIHHAFEKIGWPESRVVWLYALTQLVLSLGAIQIAGGFSHVP